MVVTTLNINRKTLVVTCMAAVMLQAGCGVIRPRMVPADVKPRFEKPTMANESTLQNINLDTDYMPESVFIVRPIDPPSELPPLQIRGLSVTESGLYDVMQLLIAQTGYSLTFEGGAEATRRYGAVTSSNLQGSLTDVLNQLAESLGFFWSVKGNRSLVIQPEQQFIIDLPPILGDDNLAGMTNTMQFLGARDVYLDRVNRSLVFRANRKALQAVETYIKRIRETRSMIVYEMQILQVDLNDNAQTGIQWRTFTGSGGNVVSKSQGATGIVNEGNNVANINADKAFSATAGAGVESLNTFIFGPRFSMNVLMTFLKSQGDVRTISQPRIGLMNGTKGLLRVGQSTTYVSRVGSINSTGINQVTVDTRDLKTGLEISLSGEEHDRTIYTKINLSITELLQFTKYVALGTDLTLPEVADRELRTQVRSRAGDTILLGGITVTRSEQSRAAGSSAVNRNQIVRQSELVIAIRPRLVSFLPSQSLLPTREATITPPSNNTPSVKPDLPMVATPPTTPTTPTTPATSAASGQMAPAIPPQTPIESAPTAVPEPSKPPSETMVTAATPAAATAGYDNENTAASNPPAPHAPRKRFVQRLMDAMPWERKHEN